jgi:hypothetical protein
MGPSDHQIEFAFSSAAPRLQLTSASPSCGPSSPLVLGAACSFSTRGSSRPLVCKAARRKARASPFASISMNLAPFAAATVAAPAAKKPAAAAGKTEAPAKKKKSLGEIFEYASKRALSGGIPGMVAMGLQVLSLMWLR